jgi:tetratricopeptide (TPR) repeat protein
MKSCEEMYKEIQPLFIADDPAGALSAIEKLLQSYPGFAQAHYDLGALYFESGDKNAALEHYRSCVDLEPLNTTYLKTLGDYYYTELGDTGEAVKLYRRVVEENPQDVETLSILGNLAIVDNDFDAAKDFFKKVLDVEPWNHDALVLFEKLEQRKVQGDRDQTPDSVYRHCQILLQAGDVDGAVKELEKLVVAHPEHASAHNDLGVLYYQNGSKDKTLMHYEEAVRLEPENLNFQKNLADFYCLELGRVEDALEIYLKVLTEEPTDIDALMAAGYVCQAVDRHDDAKLFFDRVLDIEPWNLEANENLNQLGSAQTESMDFSFRNPIN